MFCVAPGSRSSPLALAAARHPRAQLNVCIDERSLAFWALGYGRAAGGPAAVVTSSGTAVANLLPAVVEASLSGVPMLLLTADRPYELRDTGANQTIDQVRPRVKIFGGYVRWAQDVAPPSPSVPGRAIITAADAAVRHCLGLGGPPGPVHLNLQLREPLAPSEEPWDAAAFTRGLSAWQACADPFTRPALRLLAGARRGLLVVGELLSSEDVAAAVRLGQLLGWPVAADVLSGLRVGAVQQPPPPGGGAGGGGGGFHLVSHMDHLLLGGKEWWGALRPDVVLQVGPRLTSKRLNQFLEWCALADAHGGAPATAWAYLGPGAERHDASHLVTHRIQQQEQQQGWQQQQQQQQAQDGWQQQGGWEQQQDAHREQQQHGGRPAPAFARLLLALDAAAGAAVDASLARLSRLSEMAVARQLAAALPAGHGLFLGNSMPIRDMEMYGVPQAPPPPPMAAPEAARPPAAAAGAAAGADAGGAALRGAPVGANRGASGIDGVLSTAAGFAQGLARPVTLVVGDLSFLHDVNGLNLLRGGEMRPPLTVVLVNNGGGGIFSFLPVAGVVERDVFERLWGTPQNVDLEGMCRAQGVPHQRVTGPAELPRALRAAWGLNRHSVVEVVTSRGDNLGLHKALQSEVAAAVRHAYALATAARARPRRRARRRQHVPRAARGAGDDGRRRAHARGRPAGGDSRRRAQRRRVPRRRRGSAAAGPELRDRGGGGRAAARRRGPAARRGAAA
ncbi:MAG: thiamine diphosphate-binding protein, partial [Monoraphidium minutum]